MEMKMEEEEEEEESAGICAASCADIRTTPGAHFNVIHKKLSRLTESLSYWL